MGASGSYDNESDHVQDQWLKITMPLLPKKLNDYEKEQEFLRTHSKLVYASVIKYTNKLLKITEPKFNKIKTLTEKSANFNEKNNYDLLLTVETNYNKIVGVILIAVQLIMNTRKFPTDLPNNFPETLRQNALKALDNLSEILEGNPFEWVDLEKRKRCLKDELYLFSNDKRNKLLPSFNFIKKGNRPSGRRTRKTKNRKTNKTQRKK